MEQVISSDMLEKLKAVVSAVIGIIRKVIKRFVAFISKALAEHYLGEEISATIYLRTKNRRIKRKSLKRLIKRFADDIKMEAIPCLW